MTEHQEPQTTQRLTESWILRIAAKTVANIIEWKIGWETEDSCLHSKDSSDIGTYEGVHNIRFMNFEVLSKLKYSY